MRVLYLVHGHEQFSVGGAENAAFSLFHEAQHNPDLDAWILAAVHTSPAADAVRVRTTPSLGLGGARRREGPVELLERLPHVHVRCARREARVPLAGESFAMHPRQCHRPNRR